jgi:hypothetical protein
MRPAQPSPALALEGLWFGIEAHRRAATPEKLFGAAGRLNAYIDDGAREMPERVEDFEAFVETSLRADAKKMGI